MKFDRWMILCCVAFGIGGCGDSDPSQAFIPVCPESPAVLRTPIEEAMAQVDEAQELLSAAPEKAAVALGEAQRSLRHVATYYIPLQEAQQLAAEAHRSYFGGDFESTSERLDEAESKLLGIAHEYGPHTAAGLKEPLEILEDARLALAAGLDDGAESIQKLLERLQLMSSRAELVLGSE